MPELQALEWIPRVSHSERARFEAEAARVVDRVLRERLFALPVGDRVPACVATVRALLDDTHDSMEALDRATRDCAAWRDVAVTVHHELYADALFELAREMLR